MSTNKSYQHRRTLDGRLSRAEGYSCQQARLKALELETARELADALMDAFGEPMPETLDAEVDTFCTTLPFTYLRIR